MNEQFKDTADLFGNWFVREEGQEYVERLPAVPLGHQRQQTQQQQAQQLVEVRHSGVRLILG